jgi:hypothetical protein
MYVSRPKVAIYKHESFTMQRILYSGELNKLSIFIQFIQESFVTSSNKLILQAFIQR